MKSSRRIYISLSTVTALLCVPAAHAGGLFLWEIGTPTLGTASAGWAAMPEDAATAFTNPAGTVWRDETQVRVAAQALYGDVGFTNGGESNVPGNDGGNPVGWFPGGGAYAAGTFSENLGWGVAMAGNFGLGLDYDSDWAGRRFVQESDLIGMSLIPSLSWKINDCLSIGAGLNVMGAFFEYVSAPRAGLIPENAHLKYEDIDVGYGGNVGIIYRPVASTTFGITYTSKVDLTFKDNLRLSNFGPLFEPVVSQLNGTRTQIDMTVPATVTASLQQQLTPAITLYANLAWQDWSEFSGLTLALDNPDQTRVFVDEGYEDTGHVALGIRHAFSQGFLQGWNLSTGFAFDSSMQNESNLTANLVTGKAYRFGLGAGKELCPGLALDLGYTFLWSGDLDIDQTGRPPFNPRLEGTYKDTALHFLGGSVQFEF
ncbi:OmpP1/FadL family transporter [Microbulbifer pacificus]|uniref:OmpP1/FadL family transporter n=1 Tax=Microbulbifer pacificus TaxID=407164 RepID=UPI000CF50384|nr:outer membrane protein transport protein [Microbulbifer pacificus]